MLLKSKCKSVLAITLITASCIMSVEAINAYAQEDQASQAKQVSKTENKEGNVSRRILDPDAISLDSIISNVIIENKDDIYETFKSVKASVEITNENVEYITVNGSTFSYNEKSKLFDGTIGNNKIETIVVYYKNGLKKTYTRDSSNESTFKKFDVDVKKIELLSLDIEKTENLSVGDKVKVSAKLNMKNPANGMPWRIGLTFANSNLNDGDYTICLTYNKDKEIYEGYLGYGLEPVRDDTPELHYIEKGGIPYDGESKLIEVGIFVSDFYERYEPVITDKEALEKYSFSAQKYENPIKNIYYLGDKIKAEVENPDEIDRISIEYDVLGLDPDNKRYKIVTLDKKEGNVFEGDSSNLRFYDDFFCKVIVYKSNGGYDMYLKEDYPNYVQTLEPSKDVYKNYKWALLDNNWYLYEIDKSIGKVNYKMQIGWRIVDGKWYYLKSDGKMATGWEKVNGTWYYLEDNGAMATGWKKVNETWYHLKSSGAMATGWEKVNGTWYYLKPSGAMATGWERVNGTWYYLKSSGAMATGWLDLDGTWYYLDGSGAMKTGWQKISGKWYYMYGSGAMATNTVIDGWKINSSGVATKIK
ncbi:hypothetical protein [Romboutsia lituseburensis]|uniref:hypothetical protein n=1 Tax=Romboutsia lituseburensis TaxID=1537 RepID=UPI0022EA2546|nr:hypothetical protein [Romboutsia lituseburensis]